MSFVTILILVLIAVGLGVALGSVWGVLVSGLIGVAVVFVVLVAVGGIVAWRHPAHRDDGAPIRHSQRG
jgi:hypothetical protein